MKYWTITPAADDGDPRWLDHERWRQVLVRAESATMARMTAGRELAPRRPEVGNESAARRTGFEDEKLYHVQPAEPGAGISDDPDIGSRRVVSATSA